MLELGVRLEDRGAESIWKLEDPAVLRREQQAKQQAAAEQKYKKAAVAHSKKQAVSFVCFITVIQTSFTFVWGARSQPRAFACQLLLLLIVKQTELLWGPHV